MTRLMLAAGSALLAALTLAAPVGARDFGAVYVNDLTYRVFGNSANVPDGTGTDPFATFLNSANTAQRGVAEFAPGHQAATVAAGPYITLPGPRPATRASLSPAGTSSRRSSQPELTLVRDAAADFRCPVLGDPKPIG